MPKVRSSAYVLIYSTLFCAVASGCVRTVQAWPPPLTGGTPVSVRFAAPRSIVFEGDSGRDSVAKVRELQGRVVSLHGDTLVVRVTRALQETAGERLIGRPATILLDSSTIVTRSEVDGWKVGYGILASAVLIFAGLVLSGG
jgi:hypothetical protein